ncbi:hypothetical protein RvY_09113 [Ramazzottius varieornatus]|uniref:Acidic fibroblast growth factor intracellular-binding protein n=1 Tax=Ramazzottius varieornatus TaxID=947166 RepID=A0A1D1VHD1_RAMVA|nr:hypothetical protein RvY_09113 [Ramazzottius varieornatus]
MDVVDVFITNRCYFDMKIYQLWLDGEREEGICKTTLAMEQMEDTPQSKQIVNSYVSDQLRTFHLLEKCLHSPPELINNPVFQMTDACRIFLLEKYYSFDRHYVRTLLGRKYSHRARRSFEEECQKMGIKQNSCYRQYENIRRISKAVVPMFGPSAKNIQTSFFLPESLCWDYACILFLSVQRIDLPGARLADLTFDDLAHCSTDLMKGWTLGSPQGAMVQKLPMDSAAVNQEGISDLRIDKDFLYSMKEFRFLLERDTMESLKRSVIQTLSGRGTGFSPSQELLRDLCRNLLIMALNLHHSKQLKIIFTDVMEKIVSPLKTAAWSRDDVSAFLSAFMNRAQDLNEFKSRDARLSGMWRRFYTAFNSCVLRLFRDNAVAPANSSLAPAATTLPKK